MKYFFYGVSAFVGGAVGYYLGDYTPIFCTLCIFMATDMCTGVIVAAVFKNSQKTKLGGAESRACLKGIVRKIGMLVLVGIANQLDNALNVEYVRNGVMFALMFNEALSIIENVGLMGIPIPDALCKALEILNEKGDAHNDG